jgi:hypothetical protein
MAAKTPYDYISTVTADVDITLTIKAQGQVSEQSQENTVIHVGDDGSEERIILSTTPVFFLVWDWNVLTETDSGTVLDLYHTSAQGMAKSFKCTHIDHTYVVRFDMAMKRKGQAPSRYGIPGVRLKILGRILDA